MRATIILSAVALVQGVYGYAFPEPIAATPGIMFGRSDAGNLVKRQQICDLESGLSCRAGEYCVIIDGSVGCCPEGKVCGSIRTCVDHFTNGCENGGTVKGALCCDAAVPYCNTVDNTQFCDAVKQETVTKTVTSTTTICPHSNSTTTVSCPSAPTGNSTVTYVLPTLTPYPSDEEPVATPSNGVSTTIPTTLVVAETTSNNVTTPSVTSPVSSPSGFPAEEGSAVTSSVSLSVILGGIAIAFMGTLLA